MSDTPNVLIVSEDASLAGWWGRTLGDAGFDTTWCGGPHAASRCPRLDGEPCELRQRADVAVVDIQAESDELYGGWPERLCRKVPDDGRTVWVRPGSARPPHPSLSHPTARAALVETVRRAWQHGA